MTTYSTRKPPVVPGPEPFTLEDAYVLSGEIPPPTKVLRNITVSPTDTSAWGLSFTGVMEAIEKAPQSHVKGQTSVPGVPVWAIAMIFAGLVLMAIGWMLNEPVSWFLYGLIHGSTHA